MYIQMQAGFFSESTFFPINVAKEDVGDGRFLKFHQDVPNHSKVILSEPKIIKSFSESL